MVKKTTASWAGPAELPEAGAPKTTRLAVFGHDGRCGQPVMWRVADGGDGRILMLSESVLDIARWNEEEAERCPYRESALEERVRLKLAVSLFSTDEQAWIEELWVPTEEELSLFCKTDEDRIAYLTPRLASRFVNTVADMHAAACYWVDTPGEEFATRFVRSDGRLDRAGLPSDDSDGLGVRLALLLKTDIPSGPAAIGTEACDECR